MKRLALLTGVTALGMTLLSGGVAQADPYDCSYWASGNTATARCLGGHGEYRVYAVCDGQTSHYQITGPWVRVDKPSVARCYKDPRDRATRPGLQVR